MCLLFTVVAQNTYKMSVGKPPEKRPFVRPSRRWQVDIKMDHKHSRGLIRVAQGREQLWAAGSTVMNFRRLENAISCLSGEASVGSLRNTVVFFF